MEFIIVAIPVTPPGAMLAGAIKQCRPSEKTDDARIMTAKSIIRRFTAARLRSLILFFPEIVNHLEQFTVVNTLKLFTVINNFKQLLGARCFADK
ncbi:MAG: hypothetical protein LBC82_04265 [Oscillospiraceae bacterium]|jgi:hypothetical protein|nr:hypothetical protein [Oscillospiraceae bacterium]